MKRWKIDWWIWNPRKEEYEPDCDFLLFKTEDKARKKYSSMKATADVAQIELFEETLDRGGWVVRSKRIAVKDTAGEQEEFDSYEE